MAWWFTVYYWSFDKINLECRGRNMQQLLMKSVDKTLSNKREELPFSRNNKEMIVLA